jgi:hypothetical protein
MVRGSSGNGRQLGTKGKLAIFGGVFAIAGVAALTRLSQPSAPADLEAQASVDASATKSVEAIAGLRASLRDPDSLVVERVLVDESRSHLRALSARNGSALRWD